MKAGAGVSLLCFALMTIVGQDAYASGGLLRLVVNHRADLGESAYEIQVWGADRLRLPNRETELVSVTAPDGTYFHTDQTGWPVAVDSLSLDSLVSRFAGEWTIIDSLESPSGNSSQRHSFQVTESLLTNIPQKTPSIASPPDGAKLSAAFNVVHDGQNVWMRGPTIDYQTTKQVDLNATVFARNLPEVVEARTSVSISVPMESPRSLDSSPRHIFHVSARTYNFSAPVQWTVGIPEPTAAMMAILAFSGVAALRRRK
jgi:hypothetical protein